MKDILLTRAQISEEINCNELDKDRDEGSKETIVDEYAFTDEHREYMINMKQKILNKF